MKRKKQAMNPFLPLNEYIPDGEPHVFGERIYLYGSHDSERGTRYCSEENYVCWSASIYDLTDWKYEGVIFEAKQNPAYVEGKENDLYAPDVVRGNDGRYYLYYNMIEHENNVGFHDKIHVAVCDSPAGKYEHYGYVKNPDGTTYCSYLDADPAVINDNGVIRLYHGWSFSMVAAKAHEAGSQEKEPQDTTTQIPHKKEDTVEMLNKVLFGRTKEDTKDLKYPLMGANTITLADDMLTVVGDVMRIVPGQFDTPESSSFYGHAFYEASSIRKINGMYYFIYSSENSHELCYATSNYPDRDFVYRGTIISNGDVGYHGRKPEDRLNMTANNHGSLENINGQWYIFYHRQTHNTTFSRQACAEPVMIGSDGTIEQVECTSCGLNRVPLVADGNYAAACACNITNGHMPHATNTAVNADIPFVTDKDDERYITNIKDGTMVGFKYFEFNGQVKLSVVSRGTGNGKYLIRLDGEKTGEIIVRPSDEWEYFETAIEARGKQALYFSYEGSGAMDLLQIAFS